MSGPQRRLVKLVPIDQGLILMRSRVIFEPFDPRRLHCLETVDSGMSLYWSQESVCPVPKLCPQVAWFNSERGAQLPLDAARKASKDFSDVVVREECRVVGAALDEPL